MLDTAEARKWVLGSDVAKMVDGKLQPRQGVGTLGRAVITVANSEQQTENLASVYHSIERAREQEGDTPALSLSDEALASMVRQREISREASIVLRPAAADQIPV